MKTTLSLLFFSEVADKKRCILGWGDKGLDISDRALQNTALGCLYLHGV